MIVSNTNSTEQNVETERYAERLNGFRKGKNIISDENITDLKSIKVPANTALIIELEK